MSQGHGTLNIISDVEQVQGKSYDYIVVGGGTSGCPLAATLSKRFTVLLVERGGSPFGDPLIMEKKNFFRPMSQIDEFTSIVQELVSEEGVANQRGRVLGGLEHVEGTKITGTIFDENGMRHCSAHLLHAGDPERLTVLLNATVKSIIFSQGWGIADHKVHMYQPDAGDGTKPRACGIRFIKSHEDLDSSYEVNLNPASDSESEGDVVLSAGAMGSPQILMLSGIGPSELLNKFNIAPMIDAPQVGQDIRDHPGIKFLLDAGIGNEGQSDASQVVGIASSSRFLFQYGGGSKASARPRRVLLGKLAYPSSKGKLELNSTNPRKNVSVRYNYLLEENDLEEFVEMVHEMKKIARSMDSVLGTKYCDRMDEIISGQKQEHNVETKKGVSTEEELREFCKKNKMSYLHGHGGCSVGSVVDRDYKVFGVEALRVVDASALSDLLSTSPMVCPSLLQCSTSSSCGFIVGDIACFDPTVSAPLTKCGYIPVIAAVGADTVNTDTLAAELAVALGAEKLIFSTDVAGIFLNKQDPGSLVQRIDIEGVKRMVDEGKVVGELVSKVNCCVHSLKEGVRTTSIINRMIRHSVLTEILTDDGAGTMITLLKE
ncbi:hypothetical protein IFM89_001773 [Coptis chinensis]|uniref:Glucose-methanol-choline oxidoreductase N-terminal domain-containing protein n=1 Tax=Coptis chinensis TaxID=261450 RepID=A0A835LP98_9MAGN|nr:hypothetical protein IFM89_001773 [Coptis chinensis]